MPDLSVPIGELRILAAELRRVSASLADIEASAIRALNLLDPTALARAGLDQQLGEASKQAHSLSNDTRVLAGSLSSALDTFEDTDRKGAANVPLLPKPEFPLPLLAPPKRPWPFCGVPSCATIRPGSRSPSPQPNPATAPPPAFT